MGDWNVAEPGQRILRPEKGCAGAMIVKVSADKQAAIVLFDANDNGKMDTGEHGMLARASGTSVTEMMPPGALGHPKGEEWEIYLELSNEQKVNALGRKLLKLAVETSGSPKDLKTIASFARQIDALALESPIPAEKKNSVCIS